MSPRSKRDYSFTQNRELSWLRFNLRVLEEAEDITVPLLERLKFISIFTSNLDEFFMVRVGSMFDLAAISPDDIDNKTGLTPKGQLDLIYSEIPKLIQTRDRIYKKVSDELVGRGIHDLEIFEMTAEEKVFVAQYFKARIMPVLSPQIVDSRHPFPHLESKHLYIASHIKGKKSNVALGLVPVPKSLPLFVQMPKDPCRFVRMETLIKYYASSLYGEFEPSESCIMCVTRNADISFDDEKFEDLDHNEFLNKLQGKLKKRGRLGVVRLEILGKVSKEFRAEMMKRVSLKDYQVFTCAAPLCMKYAFPLTGAIPKQIAQPISFVPYEPRMPADFPKEGIIDAVRDYDKLLFFPFESVDPFIDLLRESASDPRVSSIRITIYRLASSSKIARLLSRAAENGKEVTVLMELRARFDEENNIEWSRVLEEAGCRVIYGMEGFKCHSKLCQITMRSGDNIEYITQVGTGNYNEKTNKLYTDFSYITSRKDIGEDATAFFQNMLVANLNGSYNKLLVAPTGIRPALLEHMDEQISKGKDGYICIKANSLTERVVIDKLSEASCAGVEIQLILRGICCILPGIVGKTENIHVTSIVGRYLEHSRVYCFGRGDEAKLYISSSDLMSRNLRRRVEVACPIEDVNLRNKIFWTLQVQLADNIKASYMCPDGEYKRKRSKELPTISQEFFMESTFDLPISPKKKEKTSWFKKIFGKKKK